MMIHYIIIHYIVWIVKHFPSIFSVSRIKSARLHSFPVQPFLFRRSVRRRRTQPPLSGASAPRTARGFSRPGAAARMRAEKNRQAANRLLCGRCLPVLFLFFESRIHFSACSASSQEQIESNVYESSRSRTSFEISL